MPIDDWFAEIRRKYPKHMQCGKGCSACCHGLFDISVADAVQVVQALTKLPEDLQERVIRISEQLQEKIGRVAPELPAPLLFSEDDPRIDLVVDAAGSPPCPFLGSGGDCLIYQDRPLPCRLEGIPMVDTEDGVFGDWCELNFTEGVPESALQDLKQDYGALDAAEYRRSTEIAEQRRLPDARAVTFIASAVVARKYWMKQL
jgi:Fe-S-cluster containining protein